jgi:hypothetical protein
MWGTFTAISRRCGFAGDEPALWICRHNLPAMSRRFSLAGPDEPAALAGGTRPGIAGLAGGGSLRLCVVAQCRALAVIAGGPLAVVTGGSAAPAFWAGALLPK